MARVLGSTQKQSMKKLFSLTLKAPITTAADDIHNYSFIFFFLFFFRENKLDVSSESEDSHEKSRPFFRKYNSKKLKCRLLQFLFGALRVMIVPDIADRK